MALAVLAEHLLTGDLLIHELLHLFALSCSHLVSQSC